MPYELYLETPEWKRTRAMKLAEAQPRCHLYHEHDGPFNVHHATYERIGAEDMDDLVVLCRGCHARFHGVAA